MSDIKRACVIGWPIEHSRSPLIHGTWLHEYGIEGVYTQEAVPPEEISNFLRTLKKRGYVGANITVPHKEIAFKLADKIDSAAKAVQAANTLWFDDDELCASNTDTYGFMTHLSVSVPQWRAENKRAVILGAGGAARAILYGLIEQGISEIRLLNRTRERAEKLAAYFGSKIQVMGWGDWSNAFCDSDLLVNTTTLGMKGEPALDVDLNFMPKNAIVADIVYTPLETKLLFQARELGLFPVDGLGMLLHQAVLGFEKWYGVQPKVTDELRAILVADLERT